MMKTKTINSAKTKFSFLVTFFLVNLVTFTNPFSQIPEQTAATAEKWVGTWSTAPQLVETYNNPPSPGLSNNTLRQIVHVSIGGDSLRMRFTNEFSTNPVTMHSVHIANSLGSDTIDAATDIPLYFGGDTSVTMQAGSAVMSDPFYFPLQALSNVTITIYFGSTSSDVTGHPGSRTTSYILTGNHISGQNFSGAVMTDHWYIINTIEVKAPDSAYAVAILGNSITDGRGSGTNKQNRWPDELSRRFQGNPGTKMFAVLNEGIGGNCVLGKCLGPSALSRFQRDVLDQNAVKWLIILEGINDIGYGAPGTGNNLINAFTQMINSAHANGIFVYGATLLPMKGSSYYTTQHETEREIVNDWIRTSSLLDGVIDMDKAVRNPADTLSLLPIYDSGDHLHPSEAGHYQMAEAVDLNLFEGNNRGLPVELVSFSANAVEGKIELSWTTATEINNAGFEIERSVDNKEFVTVGYVKGKGTTSEKQYYNFFDNVSGNKFYYRLKQVDFSGGYEYSNVIEVTSVPQKFNLFQNYPNPFNPSTKISYSLPRESFVTLKIYDVLGNEVATLVNEKKQAGNYDVNFNASDFSSGVYYYKLKAGTFSEVKKMILMK